METYAHYSHYSSPRTLAMVLAFVSALLLSPLYVDRRKSEGRLEARWSSGGLVLPAVVAGLIVAIKTTTNSKSSSGNKRENLDTYPQYILKPQNLGDDSSFDAGLLTFVLCRYIPFVRKPNCNLLYQRKGLDTQHSWNLLNLWKLMTITQSGVAFVARITHGRIEVCCWDGTWDYLKTGIWSYIMDRLFNLDHLKNWLWVSNCSCYDFSRFHNVSQRFCGICFCDFRLRNFVGCHFAFVHSLSLAMFLASCFVDWD